MDFISLLVYNIILLLAVSFAYLSKVKNYNRRFILLSYLTLVLFCSLRYDVGWDYGGYVEAFGFIKKRGDYYFEIGYLQLNKFFSFSPIGYIGVFAVMSSLTYLFLYKALIREKILAAGVFFAITFQFIFMANDQIRQGLAVSVFLFATRFLENKQYARYCAIIILTSVLVHTSSIFLLGAIFISRINIKYYYWILLTLISYLLYLRGTFMTIGGTILNYVPLYSKFLNNFRAEAEATTHVLIVTFWVFVSIIIALASRNLNRTKLINMYMFGSVLFPVFVDFHLFTRFLFYFNFLHIIILGLIVKHKEFYGMFLMVAGYFLFATYAFKNWGLSGGYPYRVIFFESLMRF